MGTLASHYWNIFVSWCCTFSVINEMWETVLLNLSRNACWEIEGVFWQSYINNCWLLHKAIQMFESYLKPSFTGIEAFNPCLSMSVFAVVLNRLQKSWSYWFTVKVLLVMLIKSLVEKHQIDSVMLRSDSHRMPWDDEIFSSTPVNRISFSLPQTQSFIV